MKDVSHMRGGPLPGHVQQLGTDKVSTHVNKSIDWQNLPFSCIRVHRLLGLTPSNGEPLKTSINTDKATSMLCTWQGWQVSSARRKKPV